MGKDLLLPLNLQFFAEGGEGSEGSEGGGQQNTPTFGMSEFNEFLNSNEDAKALFNAKLEAGLVAKQQEVYTKALEDAKLQLKEEGSKPAWQIEIDNLKAETAKYQKLAQQEAIKTQLAAKLATPDYSGYDVEGVLSFCLSDDAGATNAKFEAFTKLVNNIAEQKKNAELEQRIGGMSYNPFGSRGGSNQGGQENEGIKIAREVAKGRADSNTRANDARKLYNL